MDPAILVILTSEATPGERSTVATLCDTPTCTWPASPYTKAVRDWFSGLVGSYTSATGQQLTPVLKTGSPPIVRVINMDMYSVLPAQKVASL